MVYVSGIGIVFGYELVIMFSKRRTTNTSQHATPNL